MSNRKQRREIDKAIQHLMQFQVEQEPWSHLMEGFLSEIFTPLANRYDFNVEDAENRIMTSDYSFLASVRPSPIGSMLISIRAS